MAQAVLAFGANLGDRIAQVKQALQAVGRLAGTCVQQVSSAYETPAFGVPDEQPDYINCCAVVETNLSPHALLGGCLGIEAAMGRERVGEKAARVIDIDLLFYEQVEETSQELILPHPRIWERAFVLLPLADLFPEKAWRHHDFSIAYEAVDKSGIVRLDLDLAKECIR